MEFMWNFLNSDRPGFSGLNHVLTSIMMFLLLLLIPVQPFSNFLKGILVNPLFGFMAFLTICGACLLPDADNAKDEGGSALTWNLGFIGSVMSSIMVTVSSVVTTVCHGKKDVKPYTQHRFLWHTPFIPLVMFIIITFLTPDTSQQVFSTFAVQDFNDFPISSFIILLMLGICVYAGSIVLLKKVINLFPFVNLKSSLISFLLMLVVIALGLFVSEHELKMLAYCINLGYLFHLIGDGCTDGGIPLLFPISGIWGKFFQRVKLIPITVKTGGTIESLLKIVFFTIDCGLVYLVFFRGLFHS